MVANLSKAVTPYLVDAGIRVGTYVAGEAIDQASPVFIHTDGKVYMCQSTNQTITNISKFDGFVIKAALINEVVTVWGLYTRIHVVASGMTIGGFYYIDEDKGVVVDTADGGESAAIPFAKAVSATDIRIIRSPM
jgi:hypothetical protein